MAGEDFTSIDDYEDHLAKTLRAWRPEQRVALAAGLAERWLPAYEAFSTAEAWGDPASLRRMLEAVWGHLQGRALRRADAARYAEQLNDSTPHMDDFDAYEALMACAILGDALRCCERADNLGFAVRAALSCFEIEEPDWPLAPAEQQRVWQQIAIRHELQDQLDLIAQIAAITRFEAETIRALRGGLRPPRFLSEPARKRPAPSGPPAITNQTAFEQYRRMVEADLRGRRPPALDPNGGPYLFAALLLGEWMGRYSRRLNAIRGEYGQLADQAGRQALIAWNQARDAADARLPDWDPEVDKAIALSLNNNQAMGWLDARGVNEPHGYGPSLRRLWLQARDQGRSAQEAWHTVRAWATHRPAAWAAEDQRKRKGLAHSAPGLGPALAREVRWAATGDPAEPWAAEVDGETWRIRLNDFPDDLMYCLVRSGTAAGSFHDWPETWQRPRA